MFHLNRKRKHYDLRKGPIRSKWWIFLLPMMAAFAIGFVWPFIQGIYLSFCTFTTTSDAKLNGVMNNKAFFSNYIKAFNDPTFVRSFWYSALFAVVSLIIINVLAFTVAYFLTKELKGSNLFRTVFFMPNLIGGIVLGYIWSMIFDGILHMYGKTLVTEPVWGFWGLVVVVAWQQIGYMMIIYIAGLQAVPSDMLEAAKIDGASGWQTLWRVTIPNVMPSITICTFLSLTNGFNGKAFFHNYIKAFQDPTFVRSFWYSALFAVVSLIIINVLAFTVAYFLTKELKGSNLFRTVFFMPNLIGGIVLGYKIGRAHV